MTKYNVKINNFILNGRRSVTLMLYFTSAKNAHINYFSNSGW